MPFRVVRHRRAAAEFFQLPPDVRLVYERAIRRLAVDPFASGAGYRVSQLSPPSGLGVPLWAIKVGGYRMFFLVDGDLVKIGGFGGRAGFYRKLARAKELARESRD